MTETILFDRNEVEHLDDLGDRPRRLGRGKLLWVDVDRASAEEARRVAEAFGLDSGTQQCLADSNDRAVFNDHGRYIHVTTYAPNEDDEGELVALECVVGENWVITAHDVPIPVLEEFASRVSGSGDTGSLDGPAFLAALLEWVLGAYSAAFERIEQRLEEFDIEAMRGDAEGSSDIERLIQMRKEVGKLRRALAAHRSALVSLTHPELEALGDHASSEPVSPEPDALEANSSSTGIGSSCAVITQFSPTTHSSAISLASSSPFGAYAVTTMYRP